MTNQIASGEQPQDKSTKTSAERFPWCYDSCPQCGKSKAKASPICRDCRYQRSAVDQPSDLSVRHIPLTQGQVAIVSASKYDALSLWRWHAAWAPSTKSFYAVRYSTEDGKQANIFMHREVINAPAGQEVDHKNHNTLDNQDSNLRIANRRESIRNRGKLGSNTASRFIGVTFDKRNETKPWRARIEVNEKRTSLGYFFTEIEAAQVYDEAAAKHHGEFAVLNFPRPNFHSANYWHILVTDVSA